jgi:hypothetical protein
MDTHLKLDDPQRVRRALEAPPEGLGNVYSDLLKRIGNEEHKLFAIWWIAYTAIPMSSNEYIEALRTSTKLHYDELRLHHILTWCEGLVSLDDGGMVRLIRKRMKSI